MRELSKIFFFNPFIAFYNGLKLINYPKSKNFLILFFGFFGYTMIFQENTDGFRHSLNVADHYVGLSFNEFINELILLFQFTPSPGTNDDPYLHILSYIAGFFNSSKALYLLASLIYGYFYVNSLYYIRGFINVKFNFYIILIFLSIIFIKGFEGINSIRNWTGSWCLFYTVVKYVATKDKKVLFLLILPPLIHFQYIVISIPVIIAVLFPNYRKGFFIIYLLSFIISEINIANYALSFLEDGLFKSKTELYQQDIEEINLKRIGLENRASFHKLYAYDSFKYYIEFLFIVILLFFSKKINMKFFEHKKYYIFSSSALLLLAFSNISTTIPSLAKRLYMNANLYILVFILCAYIFILKHNKKADRRLRFLLTIGIPFFMFFMFMQISYISEFANVVTILPIPIGLFFLEDGLTIKILIKEMVSFIF